MKEFESNCMVCPVQSATLPSSQSVITMPFGLKTFSRKSVSLTMRFWLVVFVLAPELTLLLLRAREVALVDGGDTRPHGCFGA